MPDHLHHGFWAKLGDKTWPEEYHPVLCHLVDVAAVTAELWSKVLRRQVRAWVAKRLDLPADDCGKWLAFWCGAHDIGKVSPGFQYRPGKSTTEDWVGSNQAFFKPAGNRLVAARPLQEWSSGSSPAWKRRARPKRTP